MRANPSRRRGDDHGGGAASSSVLIDDLVWEFLVRLAPEDPASLARVSLVSKQWHRVITGPGFRRRFREFHFHRSPPLLGYIANFSVFPAIRFVPTSSFRPRHADNRSGVRVVNASRSHGRVLLQQCYSDMEDTCVLLSVWDPITDEQHDLPHVPLEVAFLNPDWDAAVICNHTHRSSFQFEVIFVGTSRGRQLSCFYSSESDSWSDPIPISVLGNSAGMVTRGTCVHIGSALYFTWINFNGHNLGGTMEILQYDLPSHQVCCTIPLRHGSDTELSTLHTRIIGTEDGRLAVANTRHSTLRLWVREHGAWGERRTIDLRPLLPVDALSETEGSPARMFVAGFAQIGRGVIFLCTTVGFFTVDLNSGRSEKVGDGIYGSCGRIVPYMSFCTPAPGAVFKDEVPGAGAAISRDEVPGVAAAISRDVVPGTAVAVSTDEGL